MLAGLAGALGIVAACTGNDPALVTGENVDAGASEAGPGGDDAGAEASADAGADAGGPDGGDSGAGCERVTGDLLTNGSFELTSASTAISFWTATPPLVQRAGQTDACMFWAEQTSTTANLELAHELDLGVPAAQDTKFELGMSVRTLDGNAAPVVVQLRVVGGTYKATKTPRLNDDGSWTRVAVVLPLPEPGARLAIEIYTEQPRSLGFDRVFVRRAP